jgi:site-specific recombinase XerD
VQGALACGEAADSIRQELTACRAAGEAAIRRRAKLSPDNFWLHKFRATLATRHLWAGVDLRTVQHWMGRKDLESTMRYLKPNLS